MGRQGLGNLLQSILLVAGMVGLLLAIGWLFGGAFGMAWALLVGVIPLFVSIRIMPAIILKMYGARPLAYAEAPRLFAAMDELCRRAELVEKPRLHYIPSAAPLIFSIGKGDTAAIAMADGFLRLLTLREIVAVLAHELSHIRNSDTWVMSFADVVTRVTRTISLMGQLLVIINLPLYLMGERSLPWLPILLMMLAPTVSALLQLSLSRTREFDADLWGARISGDPAGLASALAKLEGYNQRMERKLFGRGRAVSEPSLLRTHPVTDERIRRLQDIESEMYPDRETIASPDDAPCLHPHLGEITRPPRRHFSGLWH